MAVGVTRRDPNSAGLSLGQRIRRRLALLGGSYTHPDGYIELDFERSAGIWKRDDEDARTAKFDRHLAREDAKERHWQRMSGAGFLSVGVYFIAAQIGLTPMEAMSSAGAIGFGVFLMISASAKTPP